MLLHPSFLKKRALGGILQDQETMDQAAMALRWLILLAGDEGNYDNNNKEGADVAIIMDAVEMP